MRRRAASWTWSVAGVLLLIGVTVSTAGCGKDGEDEGPLSEPVDPTDESDPRYHLTRVVPGAWPYAFTSPLLVDLAGDGWDPPGLP